MIRPNCIRWVAVMALVGAAATVAADQEPGTLTITGMYGQNAWTLTLHGTTHSHARFDAGQVLTRVYATSFDFQFEGPEAQTLNAEVSQNLTGGGLTDGAFLEIWHLEQTRGDPVSAWYLSLVPLDRGTDSSFGADSNVDGNHNRFPSDPAGYPIIGSQPLTVLAATYVFDPKSDGDIEYWYDLATFEGDLGSPYPATLSIGDGAVLEGDRGSGKLRLIVRLSNTSDHAITVAYRTLDGSATSRSDYGAASGTLTFSPGVTSLAITISVKADRIREPDESFTVELFDAVGTAISDAVATATIRNDD